MSVPSTRIGGALVRGAGAFGALALIAGCATLGDLPQYRTHGEVLTDVAQETLGKAAKVLKGQKATSVAIVNMDGAAKPASNPSTMIYDLLTVGLDKHGVRVAERDVEALYATLIEGWPKDDKLPFRVSPPCAKGTCPNPDAPRAPTCGAGADGAATGGCAGAAPSAPWVDPKRRDDATDLHTMALPGYFDRKGRPIVGRLPAASHVLGYRLLEYGVAVDSTASAMRVRRTARFDVVLRLVDTKAGTVVWSDRFTTVKEETLDAKLAPLLAEDRFSYHPPQFRAPKPVAKAAAPSAAKPASASKASKSGAAPPKPSSAVAGAASADASAGRRLLRRRVVRQNTTPMMTYVGPATGGVPMMAASPGGAMPAVGGAPASSQPSPAASTPTAEDAPGDSLWDSALGMLGLGDHDEVVAEVEEASDEPLLPELPWDTISMATGGAALAGALGVVVVHQLADADAGAAEDTWLASTGSPSEVEALRQDALSKDADAEQFWDQYGGMALAAGGAGVALVGLGAYLATQSPSGYASRADGPDHDRAGGAAEASFAPSVRWDTTGLVFSTEVTW